MSGDIPPNAIWNDHYGWVPDPRDVTDKATAWDKVAEKNAEISDLRNALLAPLSPEELKLVDKNCDWVAFGHAWNAVMKHRIGRLKKPLRQQY
jgi:hypothetical protein